jgi:hypothetical protein
MSLHVADCRHLSAALAFKGRNGMGSCVLRSVALALDLPRAVITFGTIRAANEAEIATIPNASLVPFIHCWLEVDDVVIAPTTLERTAGVLVAMDRKSYYETNGVYSVRPVPRAAFDAIARRFRLSAAFRHGSGRAGKGNVAEALLAAANVRYVLGEHRALLPKEKA